MTVDAELRATQVDLGGLMKVLGQNLYSSAEVAVRELVQNAHDSCTRRRLAGDEGFEALITVTPDAAAGTLRKISIAGRASPKAKNKRRAMAARVIGTTTRRRRLARARF